MGCNWCPFQASTRSRASVTCVPDVCSGALWGLTCGNAPSASWPGLSRWQRGPEHQGSGREHMPGRGTQHESLVARKVHERERGEGVRRRWFLSRSMTISTNTKILLVLRVRFFSPSRPDSQFQPCCLVFPFLLRGRGVSGVRGIFILAPRSCTYWLCVSPTPSSPKKKRGKRMDCSVRVVLHCLRIGRRTTAANCTKCSATNWHLMRIRFCYQTSLGNTAVTVTVIMSHTRTFRSSGWEETSRTQEHEDTRTHAQAEHVRTHGKRNTCAYEHVETGTRAHKLANRHVHEQHPDTPNTANEGQQGILDVVCVCQKPSLVPTGVHQGRHQQCGVVGVGRPGFAVHRCARLSWVRSKLVLFAADGYAGQLGDQVVSHVSVSLWVSVPSSNWYWLAFMSVVGLEVCLGSWSLTLAISFDVLVLLLFWRFLWSWLGTSACFQLSFCLWLCVMMMFACCFRAFFWLISLSRRADPNSSLESCCVPSASVQRFCCGNFWGNPWHVKRGALQLRIVHVTCLQQEKLLTEARCTKTLCSWSWRGGRTLSSGTDVFPCDVWQHQRSAVREPENIGTIWGTWWRTRKSCCSVSTGRAAWRKRRKHGT